MITEFLSRLPAFACALGLIRCVGDGRLGHNFLQWYRSGDRVSANTLHSANDARTAWDKASMKVAA